MKNTILILFFSFILIGCKKDDDGVSTNEDRILATWNLDAAFMGDAFPFIIIMAPDALECYKNCEITFNSNGTVNYQQIVYDVATETCIENPYPFQNFQWEYLNASTVKLSFTYLDDDYEYIFNVLINGNTLTLEDDNLGNYTWKK